MAGEPARGIALMGEIDHVRGLGKAQLVQVADGIGGFENLRLTVFIRHQTAIRKPDAQGFISEFQHAPLRRGKDKGNQARRVAVRHA